LPHAYIHARAHACTRTQRSMNISVREYIGLWAYLSVGISVREYICPWVYRSVGISVRGDMGAWTHRAERVVPTDNREAWPTTTCLLTGGLATVAADLLPQLLQFGVDTVHVLVHHSHLLTHHKGRGKPNSSLHNTYTRSTTQAPVLIDHVLLY